MDFYNFLLQFRPFEHSEWIISKWHITIYANDKTIYKQCFFVSHLSTKVSA